MARGTRLDADHGVRLPAGRVRRGGSGATVFRYRDCHLGVDTHVDDHRDHARAGRGRPVSERTSRCEAKRTAARRRACDTHGSANRRLGYFNNPATPRSDRARTRRVRFRDRAPHAESGVPSRRRGTENFRVHVLAARLQHRQHGRDPARPEPRSRAAYRRGSGALRERRSGVPGAEFHDRLCPCGQRHADPGGDVAWPGGRPRGNRRRAISRDTGGHFVRVTRLHIREQYRWQPQYQPGYFRHRSRQSVRNGLPDVCEVEGNFRQPAGTTPAFEPDDGTAVTRSPAGLGTRDGTRVRHVRTRLRDLGVHRRCVRRRVLPWRRQDRHVPVFDAGRDRTSGRSEERVALLTRRRGHTARSDRGSIANRQHGNDSAG